MRKTILAAALAVAVPVLGGATVACNSTWWQNFQNDPVQQVQSFEQGVQVVLNDAQLAWNIVQPFLPAASAAQITQQYNNAVYAVNGALQVLNDAVAAAIAAQQPNPDFTALMTAVTNAVSTVIAIVAQYVNNPPAPAPLPSVDGGAPPAPKAAPAGPIAAAVPMLTAAQQVLASLQKQYHTAPAASH